MKRIEGTPDLLCTGTALVDSIIRGFDPTPVSAAGYRAESGTLHVGGEAVGATAGIGSRAQVEAVMKGQRETKQRTRTDALNGGALCWTRTNDPRDVNTML